jgi:hypothetical protein
MTRWEREKNHIEPLSLDEAVELYETFAQFDPEAVPFKDAFPGVEITEAWGQECPPVCRDASGRGSRPLDDGLRSVSCRAP